MQPGPAASAADVWTFVTYALLHADWMHLLFNSVWLLAFGTPLARRFGAARFLAFCAVTAAAGALAHLMTHFGQMVPMVGASGAISGTMSGAMRFAFQRGGPLRFGGSDESYRVPALSLVDTLPRSARADVPRGLVRTQSSVRTGFGFDHR